jgi:hypothetical protein
MLKTLLKTDEEHEPIVYSSIFCNKKVDIKFRVHDAFMEQPSTGTLKAKKMKAK